jgi:hypothetical protein
MTMRSNLKSEAGVTLIETMIAMLVLTVGAMGMAATFLQGMKLVSSSPAELLATQKAAEAIESVFSARDSHTITWAQINNKKNGGIFLNEAIPVSTGGEDGIVNTGDEGEVVESVVLPGPDQTLSTADDRTELLDTYSRKIAITELSNVLRSITVTIEYKAGAATQTYTLTAYISSFA